MAILVLDPIWEERIKEMRGDNDWDEVWEGVTVMSPLANLDHQDIGGGLYLAFIATLGSRKAGRAFHGCNVSDRAEGWAENYRIPDVAVYLATNPARACGTHWFGGPDLAVEILSPQDPARDKLPFYASVGVRELLIIDRNPWALELYRLSEGSLGLVARVTPGSTGSIGLEVLPLTLRLVTAVGRPEIEVAHQSDVRTWTL